MPLQFRTIKKKENEIEALAKGKANDANFLNKLLYEFDTVLEEFNIISKKDDDKLT